MHACVARPVRKDAVAREPTAKAAEQKEWANLRSKDVLFTDVVREFNEIAQIARRDTRKVHLGRAFGLMVEKGSEFPKDDPRRKYKYRVVFHGNNVVGQNRGDRHLPRPRIKPGCYGSRQNGRCLR